MRSWNPLSPSNILVGPKGDSFHAVRYLTVQSLFALPRLTVSLQSACLFHLSSPLQRILVKGRVPAILFVIEEEIQDVLLAPAPGEKSSSWPDMVWSLLISFVLAKNCEYLSRFRMAATMHARMNRKKLSKLNIIRIWWENSSLSSVLNNDSVKFLRPNCSEEILNPSVPMALRLSGILMGDITRRSLCYIL